MLQKPNKPLKFISLREFQLKGSQYMDKLPLVLTRYNLFVGMVIPYPSGGSWTMIDDDGTYVEVKKGNDE